MDVQADNKSSKIPSQLKCFNACRRQLSAVDFVVETEHQISITSNRCESASVSKCKCQSVNTFPLASQFASRVERVTNLMQADTLTNPLVSTPATEIKTIRQLIR